MRIVLFTVAIAAGFYLVGALVLCLKQDALLFFPDTSNFNNCGGTHGLPLTPITVESGGETLRYHRFAHADPKGVLIVFHGNTGNACQRDYFIDLVTGLPIDVWLAEYPGYAGGKGSPSERAILPNAEEMVRHARAAYPGKKVFLLGESLGTGAATHAAAEVPVDGLILTTPYTSVVEVAAEKIRWFPIALLSRHTFRAEKWAQKVHAPVLILHGTVDPVIPYAIGQKQAKNFPKPPTFLTIDGAAHANWLALDGDRIKAEFESFLRKQLGF